MLVLVVYSTKLPGYLIPYAFIRGSYQTLKMCKTMLNTNCLHYPIKFKASFSIQLFLLQESELNWIHSFIFIWFTCMCSSSSLHFRAEIFSIVSEYNSTLVCFHLWALLSAKLTPWKPEYSLPGSGTEWLLKSRSLSPRLQTFCLSITHNSAG